jgi:hypothetical protein
VNVSSQLREFKITDVEEESRGRKFIIRDCPVNEMNYVVKELIDDPLLVDGSLVLFTTVAVITSVNPLRIYRSRDDTSVSFTPNFQSLPKHFCLQSKPNEKSAKSIEKQYPILNDNMDAAIASVLALNEQSIVGGPSKRFANMQQSIQLMQFNFIADSRLNLHITDVKGSVEVSNGTERIIYSALKLAGASNSYEFSCR